MTLLQGLTLLVLLLGSVARCSGAAYYVSPSGSDRAPGTSAAPVKSLELAIERAAQGGPGSEVVLADGLYFRDKSLMLDSLNHVSIRAQNSRKARLVGGRIVHNFRKVTDAAILARLDPQAQKSVVVCDLKAEGITDYGEITARGFGRSFAAAGLELFYNGQPMQLARWPNEDWALIDAVPSDNKDHGFQYQGDRPARWKEAEDAWVHGYWAFDWADTYDGIESIDLDNRTITVKPPYNNYGFKAGKRYYALNILEELDAPGEWYLDRDNGLLYFWPPSPIQSGEAIVSTLPEPMVVLQNTRGVTISGLVIEAGRGCGVEVRAGSDNLVSDCLVRNLGTVGISIGELYGDIFRRLYDDTVFTVDAGTNNGVSGCEITQTGEGGVMLGGGERKTLTPGRNFVEDCNIHNYARWVRTYRPAVSPYGVGQIVRHNLIHDAPHTGVLANGNDHLVEYNEIHHVCFESGDAGAFYIGRDWTQRGDVVRYNYFHDIKGVQGQRGFTDVMGVYLDDWASGTQVYGNVFERAGRAAMIGGGRDNTVVNNIFIDCNPAVHVDARGTTPNNAYFDGSNPILFNRLKAVDYSHPPYSSRYPGLVRILEEDPKTPRGNRIALNVVRGPRFIQWVGDVDRKLVAVQKNFVSGEEAFQAPDPETFQLPPDSPVLKAGFRQIPFKEIGIRPGVTPR
ncbi:MAG: right-handed parallel beta-helix repeat-containing protein [Armatimonadetes bacterium]|nr:right-handed parallel beta-helix repeat-containing protein [Armatimonadota bacterium]